MLQQATMSEREHDDLLDLRKSVDDLTDQIKELNHKLPKAYEIENLVKSIHRLTLAAEGK
jgi:Tfp pilus assembly protein PilO